MAEIFRNPGLWKQGDPLWEHDSFAEQENGSRPDNTIIWFDGKSFVRKRYRITFWAKRIYFDFFTFKYNTADAEDMAADLNKAGCKFHWGL